MNSICSVTPTTLEEWALDPQCGLNDSEAEDVLHAINPNDVFPPGPPGECFSESDSGASEDPLSDSSPEASELAQPPTAIYQVVYDIGRLNNIKTEPKQQSVDVISIELDEWSSQMLISESCVVNELPLVPTGKPDDAPSTAAVSEDAHNLENVPFYPDLHLTEEEQKLLTQEGISLPSNLPLTKAEERILKKVRRKIRNKQSAQDSRRRKKEYIDGLETRSLMTQLRKLQSLIKQTATKAAQTTTCIMILIFSLTLIIFPSYSPFSYNSVSEEQGYTPTGVISRNILTDPASSSQISEDVDDTVIHPDVLSYLPDSNQSDPPGLTSGVLQQTMENPERVLHESLAQEENRSKNVSTAIEEQAKLMPMGLVSAKTQDSTKTDAAKPAHADEM
ncbi:putative cAMP responsive element binding protein 3-like protein 4 [Scleropages formosus]|uniref:Putative cAMP responsive element binding protein 3-like protein 4 n=1 Tax=Scleropages formosus TaxID=113540 RepID=A0A0P7UVV0_SCLFO|nr:putative cAMP responsive element binding protein 3-like protein 4 [Scleropages formosus]